MNSIHVLILCIAAIECQNRYNICDVFAPNRVFSGGVKLYRLETRRRSQLIMYTIGENGFQWEVELTQINERKSINFKGEAIECCEDYLNVFSFKYMNENKGKTYRHCIIQNVIIIH